MTFGKGGTRKQRKGGKEWGGGETFGDGREEGVEKGEEETVSEEGRGGNRVLSSNTRGGRTSPPRPMIMPALALGMSTRKATSTVGAVGPPRPPTAAMATCRPWGRKATPGGILATGGIASIMRGWMLWACIPGAIIKGSGCPP